MSFDINNWGRWSVSYNAVPPNEYAYTGLGNGGLDTLDTMKVSGFFDEVVNFLKVGHLIYLIGNPTFPIFPSREYVVVTGLNPVTVESLTGVTPLFTGIGTVTFEADQFQLVQTVGLPGALPTDLIVANATINPNEVVIVTAITGTDDFTLTFSGAPGPGMFIDVITFRATFL